MIPLFKVVSLLIRLFTRPFSNYLKNSLRHRNDHHPIIRNGILRLGQFYHVINIKIQRKIMNMTGADTYIKPLSDDKALESGAEFIGEILAYGTLLTWGVFEINKYAAEARAKEDKHNEVIANVHAKLQGIENNYKNILEKVQIIKEYTNKEYVDEETFTDIE